MTRACGRVACGRCDREDADRLRAERDELLEYARWLSENWTPTDKERVAIAVVVARIEGGK